MLPLLALLLAGCTEVGVVKVPVDADNDGYDETVDCDDGHATVHPDAAESCDGLDNDCDGTIDEDAADRSTFYADADGDGYGDPAVETRACALPEGHVEDATDCDDADADDHPGGIEVCNEDDEDCDGAIDEDATDASVGWLDADGDGYGDPDAETRACVLPDDHVDDATDCDDTESAVHPGAPEPDCTDPVDYDCDGVVAWADDDGDGWAACEDCDDGDASLTDASTWYRDADGDLWGTDTLVTESCVAPAGFVATAGDCDDVDAARNPGAPEVCDDADLDEDCSGTADDRDAGTDAATFTTWARDADGDTYGDPARTVRQCDPPSGYLADASDCDDTAAAVNPAADEVCNGVDDDCDTLVDDADPGVSGTDTWYADADGDRFGDATAPTDACEPPAGHVADDTDCDDTDAEISPDGVEVCAEGDEDCDGLEGDADPDASDPTTWYRDGDADGHAGSSSFEACEGPPGALRTSTDCDDTDPDVSPSAPEACDDANVDEDCDGLADDDDASATGEATWHRDADTDTLGDPSVSTVRCDAPAGYVGNDDDCDDTSAAVGATRTWYRDADRDSYGGASSTGGCTAPVGYVATGGDCDDGAAGVNPGAAEVCDAVDLDEDCDGLADDLDPSATGGSAGHADADGDGYGDPASPTVSCDGDGVADDQDCDDTDGTVNPAGVEDCGDGVDQDCSGADEACEPRFSGEYVVGDEAWAVTWGNGGSDFYGEGLAAGDFDGDGAGDVVIGAFQDESGSYTNYGTVYGFYGLPAAGDADGPATADATFYNTSATYYGWGHDPSRLGDLDGDGAEDWSAVGQSWLHLVAGGWTGTRDRASVATVVSATNAIWAHPGGARGGDGAWMQGQFVGGSANGGTLTVFVGLQGTTATAIYDGTADGDQLGTYADGDGDLDGDGQYDVIVSASGRDSPGSGAGAVYVFLGEATGTVAAASADAELRGTAAGDTLGYRVRFAGDIDRDGYDELLAGAPYADVGATDSGAIYVVPGPLPATGPIAAAADATVAGLASESLPFAGTFDLGDLDGDDTLDLAVARPADGRGGGDAGAVDLLYGPLAGTLTLPASADASLLGATANTRLGLATQGDGLAFVPDADGDGDDEIVVSTPYTRSYTGTVWWILGH